MNALFEAAKEICDFMKIQGWQFCVIGGLAVQQWGEPRTTLDADITLLSTWGEEEVYVDKLLSNFTSRIADPREFALSHRVLLLRGTNWKDIDVTLGGLPFEVDMVARAKVLEFAPGYNFPCCTAEDLFVMKLFAGRPQDLIDAKGIVARQKTLDAEYILTHLNILAEIKEDDSIVNLGRQLLK